MFVHANSFEQNMTNLENGQLSVFIRLGSDYKNNFYEYEIPLKLTPHRNDYNKYSTADRLQVWPKDNMLDIPLSLLTGLKRERNKAKAIGQASYNRPYSAPIIIVFTSPSVGLPTIVIRFCGLSVS